MDGGEGLDTGGGGNMLLMMATVPLTAMAFVTDSNRPQPLEQPPPTACPTASGAASEVASLLMHPWGREFAALISS